MSNTFGMSSMCFIGRSRCQKRSLRKFDKPGETVYNPLTERRKPMHRIVHTRSVIVRLSLAVFSIFVIVMTTYAGGWAIVSVKDVPDYAVAGKPFMLTFAVRQHGMTLVDGLKPVVTASNTHHQSLKFFPKPTGSKGEYSVELRLAEPGTWNVDIDSRFLEFMTGRPTEDNLRIPQAGYITLPLKVVATGIGAPGISDSERGNRLFSAKGCNACHGTGIGPDLKGKRLSADYVKKVLADPAAMRNSREESFEMPNLSLKPGEIAALTEFLLYQ
jgi:mono/diheme cytochrome c family protein